jgi:hypothetical protein
MAKHTKKVGITGKSVLELSRPPGADDERAICGDAAAETTMGGTGRRTWMGRRCGWE